MLYIFALFVAILSFGSTQQVHAAEQCFSIANGDLCLDMERRGGVYDVRSRILRSSSVNDVYCQVKTPGDVGSTIFHVSKCNDSFQYNGSTRGEFTIYTYVNRDLYTYTYNFDTYRRQRLGSNVSTSSSYNNSYNNSYNDSYYNDPYYNDSYYNDPYYNDPYYNDPYYSSTSSVVTRYNTVLTTRPRRGETLPLRIDAVDRNNTIVRNYNQEATIEVYYKGSNGGAWRLATPGIEYTIRGSNVIRFRDGRFDERDYIRFMFDYEYEVRIRDRSGSTNVSQNILVLVGSATSNNSNNNNNQYYGDLQRYRLDIFTRPSKGEDVSIRIDALDNNGIVLSNYNGYARMEVYYRSNSTNTWRLGRAGTDYTIRGTTSLRFSNGRIDQRDYIRFNYDYEYELRFYDEDNRSITATQRILVGNASGGSTISNDIADRIVVRTSTNQGLNVPVSVELQLVDRQGIPVRMDGYNLQFRLWYNTTQTFFTSNDEILQRDFLNSSSLRVGSLYDRGNVYLDRGNTNNDEWQMLNNFVTFYREGYYKVEFFDSNNRNVVGTITFNVRAGNAGGSITNAYTLDARGPTQLATYQNASYDVSVVDRDNRILSNYKTDIGYSIWYNQSSRSFSSNDQMRAIDYPNNIYFDLGSRYRNGYVQLNQSYTSERFTDFILFKRSGYYKISFYDMNDQRVVRDVIVQVGAGLSNNQSSSSISNTNNLPTRFELTIQPQDVGLGVRNAIDLLIFPIVNNRVQTTYRGIVDIKVYRDEGFDRFVEVTNNDVYYFVKNHTVALIGNGSPFINVPDQIYFKRAGRYKILIVERGNAAVFGERIVDAR